MGKFKAKGKLPVTVCSFKPGDGIAAAKTAAEEMQAKLKVVDSIAQDGISKKLFPVA